MLLLYNGQRSVLVLDRLGRLVSSHIGAAIIRRESEPEAKRMPPARKSGGCTGIAMWAVPSIVLLFFVGPRLWRRLRRGRSVPPTSD